MERFFVYTLSICIALIASFMFALSQGNESYSFSKKSTILLPNKLNQLTVKYEYGEFYILLSEENKIEIDATTTAKSTLHAKNRVNKLLNRIQSNKRKAVFDFTKAKQVKTKVTLYIKEIKNLNLHLSEGNIELNGLNSNLSLYTVYSNITLKNIQGDITTSTSSGKTIIKNSKSSKIEVASSSGDIFIENTTAIELNARATSGDISIINPKIDKLKAQTTSGTLIATSKLPFKKSMKLMTTSGKINLTIPKNSDTKINLHSLSGLIKSEIQIKDKKDHSSYLRRQTRILGKIGSGKGLLKASTTSGSITLKSN